MPRYRSATPRATDRKLLNTTADILAVVPGEGSSVSTMPITRSRTVKPVPALISADADVESSVMVFLNDVHRYRVSCNFCPVLTRRSLLTGSLLAADAATRHDQPDRNLTGGQSDLYCAPLVPPLGQPDLLSDVFRRFLHGQPGRER